MRHQAFVDLDVGVDDGAVGPGPGVVHQDVDRSESRGERGDRLHDLLAVGDVGSGDSSVAAGFAQHRFELIARPGDEADLGAAARSGEHHLPADAARRTGDDGNGTLPAHVSTSPLLLI
jgi:hypothetical protein